MLHVQRVLYADLLLMALLVGVYGCGEPSTPPPGAPPETSAPTIDLGRESEPASEPEPTSDEATKDEAESPPSETPTEEPAADAPSDEGTNKTSSVEAGGDWGTLTGRIVYDGKPPKPEPIDSSKDPKCKEKLTTENLLVGADGGLANAVVMLRTKNVKVNPEYEKMADAKIDLTNKNCRFEPHVQIVRLSQTLLLKNDDPTGHNTNISPLLNTAINPVLAEGSDPIPYTLSVEEAVPVKVSCNIHPWMGAWIVARKDPYAAVTDADGNFTIKDLPAGQELEFRLWQEAAGYLKNATFKGGKTDTKGNFKIKLKPGENNLGDIKVSSSIFKK